MPARRPFVSPSRIGNSHTAESGMRPVAGHSSRCRVDGPELELEWHTAGSFAPRDPLVVNEPASR